MTKRILFIIVCLALLGGCNKVPQATGSTITTDPVGDTVTITDNGITYSLTGQQVLIRQVTKELNYSLFWLLTTTTTENVVNISINGPAGPANSTGIYRLTPADSTTGSYEGNNYFTEFVNGTSYVYNIDSVILNINTAAGTTIMGSYEAWTTGATGRKVITGSIKCHNASVN